MMKNISTIIVSFSIFAIVVFIIKKFVIGDFSLLKDGVGIIAIYTILYSIVYKHLIESKTSYKKD